MVHNDQVKNVKYRLLKTANNILDGDDLGRVKEVLSDEKYLSFHKEIERFIDDIPFPEDFTFEDEVDMIKNLAENYLFDIQIELEGELDDILVRRDDLSGIDDALYDSLNEAYMDCQNRLIECKELIMEISGSKTTDKQLEEETPDYE